MTAEPHRADHDELGFRSKSAHSQFAGDERNMSGDEEQTPRADARRRASTPCAGHRRRDRPRRLRPRQPRRKVDAEGAAPAEAAVDGDAAAVGLGDVLDDGEAEAGAAELAAARLVDAVEALEEPRQVLARDAAALVARR